MSSLATRLPKATPQRYPSTHHLYLKIQRYRIYKSQIKMLGCFVMTIPKFAFIV